jgi:Protein of unknown function (DUF1176)
MNTSKYATPFIFVLCLASAASAQYLSNAKGGLDSASDPRGIYFQHKDWELACDNTGMCRAAGYTAEGSDSRAASVLLTRAAGAATPIRVRFKAQQDRKGNEMEGEFTLKVGSANVGRFGFDDDIAAVAAKRLLPLLLSAQHVDVVVDADTWRISLAGLGAVALKMDEVQKRIGTIGAFAPTARGKQDETAVAQPMPVATIKVPKLPPADGLAIALLASLKAAIGNTDCSVAQPQITGEKLNNRQVIIQIDPCERGAYNSESAFYIANIQVPHAPKRFEPDGPAQEYVDGVISGYHKGRGIGDCISTAEFAWNGVRFVKVNAMGTGMCRGFMGGAWELPTVISKVVNGNAAVSKK